MQDKLQYWLGPHGIRVPLSVDRIVAEDGGNTLWKTGIMTEMGISNPPSKEEYLNKFAELRDDGHYWWKGYWNGPYGIRVPLTVQSVLAVDGYNHFNRDGSESEMHKPDICLSKEEYFEKYTELRDDGHYWWKTQKKQFSGNILKCATMDVVWQETQ